MWNRSRGWLTKFKSHAQISEEKLGHCWLSRERGNLGPRGHMCLNVMKGGRVYPKKSGILKLSNREVQPWKDHHIK